DEGWSRVAKIAAPTLLIRGILSDILNRDIAKRFCETVPDCRLVEVAGAGHSVPLDKPDEFLTAAQTFL
ncbi:MAG: alpha/beta hydrolase, partial [Alphaproteobacteria bacterium]